MTDFGTMMALMNLLGGMKSGGTEKGKADMSAMLPVLIGMLNAKPPRPTRRKPRAARPKTA